MIVGAGLAKVKIRVFMRRLIRLMLLEITSQPMGGSHLSLI
ncbi:MAG: hypothetical protein QOF72_2055 [Blastocatellia bacterium]|nr:hypothetical protein [Blastocatellia bacterium]